MIRHLLLFNLLLFSICLNAQDTSKVNKPHHNTISLGITGLLGLSQNAEVWESPIAIIYKRNKENKNIRISFNLKTSVPHGGILMGGDRLRVVNDTLVVKAYRGSSYFNPEMRFGLEWIIPKKKIEWIIGADMILGTRSFVSQINMTINPLDSLDVMVHREADPLQYSTWFYDRTNSTYDKNTYLVTGIAAHFGMQFRLSGRWNALVQVNPDFKSSIHIKRKITDEHKARLADNSVALGGTENIEPSHFYTRFKTNFIQVFLNCQF